MKYWIIIISVIVFSAIIAGAIFFVRIARKMTAGAFRELSEMQVTLDSIPPEYKAVFPMKYQQEFMHPITYSYKRRNPVASVNYTKDYCVIVYKMPLSGDSALSRIIKEEDGLVKATNFLGYASCQEDYFKLYYRFSSTAPARRIYLKFDSAAAKIITKNDTLAYYSLPGSGFSMRYGKDSTIDMYTGQSDHLPFSPSPPIDLLFLKRNSDVFLFVMSLNRHAAAMPKNLLYKLVTDTD